MAQRLWVDNIMRYDGVPSRAKGRSGRVFSFFFVSLPGAVLSPRNCVLWLPHTILFCSGMRSSPIRALVHRTA